MNAVPRLLPLVGVAIGGVLAVNALAGARDLPSLLSGASAFAEEAAAKVAPGKTAPAKPAAAKAEPAKAEPNSETSEAAPTGQAADTATGAPQPGATPKAVCAPTAAELAKQAGLSPAELQVLQSLGARRGQLDQRESDLNTQLALMAAAEAKLDAKIKSLNSLKGEVQGLLNDTNTRQQGEIDRLVKVYEGMKAKDAAPRLSTLDDSVRIPIAAKMKEKSLAAILAQMSAPDAKKLTESLARRFSDAQAAAAKASQIADSSQPAPKPSVDPTAPEPKKLAAAPRKAPPRKKAPAAQQAARKAPAAPTASDAPAADPAKTG